MVDMRFWLALFCLYTLAGSVAKAEPADPFTELDYKKMERSIGKEPTYVGAPRYALFIFDPQARFRVWAVLDKSRADLPYYDVLYLDRNGNGDLTEPGERFVGTYDEKLKTLTIHVGDLAVPGTKLTHTDLRFITVEPHGYAGFWFGMKWDGKVAVDGGYGKEGTILTAYAASANKAPVLRPTPLGPLSFRFWDAEVALPIGKARDVQFGVGNPGSGPDTFCAVDEHYLIPGKDILVATLIARDREGKEVRSRTEIQKHC
jgi:hypothetical protein